MKANAQFINLEKIEGYVYSTGSKFNELSEQVSGPNSKNPGTKFIAGDLDIAVDEDGLNVITVHYTYVTEIYAKSGKTNSTFTALKRIIDNPDRTWINGGKDNAFKVSCTQVSLAVNDFIARDGTKVAAMRNEGGFCEIINELAPEDERHTFANDMIVTKVTRFDADPEKDIKEDYATISGYAFGYGPIIFPVTFNIRNEGGVKHFEDLDPSSGNPIFTKVWGKINSLTVTKIITEESAFGEAAVQTVKRKSKEYLITGTSKVPYDFGDEDILTMDDIKKMMQDRQVKLAEIEERHNKKQQVTATNEIPAGDFVF